MVILIGLFTIRNLNLIFNEFSLFHLRFSYAIIYDVGSDILKTIEV